VITDDEVMRVLEQANPARLDDPIPMLDVAGYRDELHARRTTLTLIDGQPTPTEPNGGRRWPIPIAAAAVVLVGVGSLIVSGGRDTREIQRAGAPPVANGLIAFADGDDTGSPADIYVAAADGTGLRALTATADFDEDAPAWSPDGSRLAFVRTAEPQRSPCEFSCLVVVDPSTGAEMLSVDLASSVAALLGTPVELVPLSVSWSPDREQIVVVLGANEVGGRGGNALVGVDLQTRARTAMETDSDLAEWSPDGRWLLVQPNHPSVDGSLLLVPADTLTTGGLLDVDGLPEARQLPDPYGAVYNDVAGWTPDSSALVVGETFDRGNPDQEPSSIDVVSVADGERRTVIENGFDPALSPDGSQIAYLRRAPGAGDVSEIWVAAADGGHPRLVTTALTPPTWSPDGRVLLAIDEDGWFTVRPDGTGRTMLAPSLNPDIGQGEYPPRFFFWERFIPASWQPLPSE
jgi:dipeptidyl aminopeptidase/acylaminoacyl peptidase